MIKWQCFQICSFGFCEPSSLPINEPSSVPFRSHTVVIVVDFIGSCVKGPGPETLDPWGGADFVFRAELGKYFVLRSEEREIPYVAYLHDRHHKDVLRYNQSSYNLWFHHLSLIHTTEVWFKFFKTGNLRPIMKHTYSGYEFAQYAKISVTVLVWQMRKRAPVWFVGE